MIIIHKRNIVVTSFLLDKQATYFFFGNDYCSWKNEDRLKK